MEVSILKNNSLRIKGKNAILAVDPQDKSESNAALVLCKKIEDIESDGSDIVINGPGEYETGGIKISAIRNESDLVYAITIDSVTVLLGKVSTISRAHTKLKESNILAVYSDEGQDASFISGLVTNTVLFYGEKASELAKAFGQEDAARQSKYVTTIDKLPAEVETYILE